MTGRARPIDPRTRAPLPPRAQPGYYPGYRTLRQRAFWDAKTRDVVLARVEQVPPIRFFTAAEAELVTVLCNHIVPQDDRADDRRIPIVNQIDRRLYTNQLDGYRFEHMPPDREAYRLGLEGIDLIARHRFGHRFVDLGYAQREAVLKDLHDGAPPAGHGIWARLPVQRYWMLLVQDCVEAYYAHPWAWDEIGFGGPAYPRAYTRLERGEREPWEVDEQRYDWEAPPGALSDRYEPIAGSFEHHAPPGQGGIA